MTRIAQVAEGLRILALYRDAEIYPGHDRIVAGPADESVVSIADRAKLHELGWNTCGEGGWVIYT